MEPTRIAVVDEQEIFRRGVVACLDEPDDLEVVLDAAAGPLPDGLDLAVVSGARAEAERFACPLLVYSAHPVGPRAHHGNRVRGVLPVAGLTPARLVGAARAVADGLEVTLARGAQDLDARQRAVLRLLAEGADTRAVAADLGCSPRTVKTIVGEAKAALRARSRAQAVAIAIRRGLV
jgi:DNA-binding NarL/FixJ family response regulator